MKVIQSNSGEAFEIRENTNQEFFGFISLKSLV